MKIKKLFLSLLFTNILYFNIFSAWVDVDGIGKDAINIYPSVDTDYVPDMVLDNNNYAHVVWFTETGAGNTDIFYLKWNGSSWVDADGAGQEAINISNSPAASKYPVIQIDSYGNPHIVWQEGNDIYYLKWNGTSWVDIDGSGQESINVSNTPDIPSRHPSFILDSTNKPHIAWHEGYEEESPLAQIMYATWNGNKWVGADGGNIVPIYNSPYASLWASIAIDSFNRPHIVWSDGDENNREIYYLKWNGSSWVDADGAGQEAINISNTHGYSSWPDIELDSFDNPYIVFEDASERNLEIYFQKWNGTSWVDVDGIGLESRNITNSFANSAVPTVKIDNSGTPHIIWHEGNVETCEIYCLKWNGAAWVDEDGSGKDEMIIFKDFENSEWATMVLDSYGYPHIVWSNGKVLQNHDIFYLKWLPGGISDTPTITPTFTIDLTYAMTPVITPTPQNPCWVDADGAGQEAKIISPGKNPVLMLDSFGKPCISWEEENSIYFLRWNGFYWVDADGAGQEAKKISYSIFNSKYPSLYLDSGDIPGIAWAGGLWVGWQNIYYLRWNGFYWSDIDGDGVESMSVNAPTGGYPQDVNLIYDSFNNPHIVWSDYPENLTWTTKDIFYIKWNGNTWVDVDGSFYESVTLGVNTDGNQIQPNFVLDNLGRPYVVWVMINGGYTALRFLKWNGSSWVDADGAGQESISLPLSYNGYGPSLALDSDGNPHISFYSETGIYYLRWIGNQWVDADGFGIESAKIDNNSFNPIYGYLNNTSLILDNLNRPNICWYDDSEGRDYIYYLRYVCDITTPTITPTHTISPTITITPTISITVTMTITPTITITPTPFPEGFFVVYPNPYDSKKSINKKIIFLNIKPGSTIHIYTISGENVIAIPAKTSIVNWELKNRFGYKVSPGIYYYLYMTPDYEVIEKGKIFIINNN